jgi:membrane-bound ClpP family serine protease
LVRGANYENITARFQPKFTQPMLRIILVLLVLGFYALHQDIWFWRTAQPVVFGVLPVGLFYHAAYTAAISLLMWGLVHLAWPGHLDDDEASGRNTPPAAAPKGTSR